MPTTPKILLEQMCNPEDVDDIRAMLYDLHDCFRRTVASFSSCEPRKVSNTSMSCLQGNNKGTSFHTPHVIDTCPVDLHASCIKLNELTAVLITPPIEEDCGTDLSL